MQYLAGDRNTGSGVILIDNDAIFLVLYRADWFSVENVHTRTFWVAILRRGEDNS